MSCGITWVVRYGEQQVLGRLRLIVELRSSLKYSIAYSESSSARTVNAAELSGRSCLASCTERMWKSATDVFFSRVNGLGDVLVIRIWILEFVDVEMGLITTLWLSLVPCSITWTMSVVLAIVDACFYSRCIGGASALVGFGLWFCGGWAPLRSRPVWWRMLGGEMVISHCCFPRMSAEGVVLLFWWQRRKFPWKFSRQMRIGADCVRGGLDVAVCVLEFE